MGIRESERVRRANEKIYAGYTPSTPPFGEVGGKSSAEGWTRVGRGGLGEAGWGPGESRRVVTAALKNVQRNQCKTCQAAVKAQLKLDNMNL